MKEKDSKKMRFEFSTAHRILFGPGVLNEIEPVIAKMGKRVFVVTGSTISRAKSLLSILSSQKKLFNIFCTETEPTIDSIRKAVKEARNTNCDFIIGFGGGSAIDTAKATAALLKNEGDLTDYLEIIGKGRPVINPSISWIAIPTTAGSGAEVTHNAVIISLEHRVKVSLRSKLMFPCLVLVDPELTYNLPGHITASTGLDAITQLIEPYVSNQANPITDALCKEGLQRASRSLLKAYKDGKDAKAREDMAIASLFGGLALANSKLGAVHGIAGPIGGMLKAPHGALCACLLPHVITVNIKALQERSSDNPALKRYNEIAQILTGDIKAKEEDAIAWIKNICGIFNLPGLESYGLKQKDLSSTIEKSLKANSMQGNPIKLKEQEIQEILINAL